MKDSYLPELKVDRKTGSEQFHNSGASLGFDILSFWSWAYSDLASNNLRGHLAEYLVARDLGLGHGRRCEWDTCDIRTLSGIKIEVKSAAYIQTWQQERLSQITFGIAPALGWDDINQRRTNTFERNSDAFVFCLIKHKDKNTFDPVNLEQWVFFVIATSVLNEKLGNQKTLSLDKLLSLNPVECTYGNIRDSLTKVLGRQL
ncbi:MAG: hypothetical protein WCP96_03995 [Methylococcaceae bacterium]